jgi:hypothetical protein
MNNAEIRMTGVGCFAAGITLSRALRRMVEAYSLGHWSGAEGFRQDPPPAIQVLQRLIGDSNGCPGQEDRSHQDEDIAGFFLSFENERLNLSVFTRGQGRRCRKYTASLEELTRLRRSRLH